MFSALYFHTQQKTKIIIFKTILFLYIYEVLGAQNLCPVLYIHTIRNYWHKVCLKHRASSNWGASLLCGIQCWLVQLVTVVVVWEWRRNLALWPLQLSANFLSVTWLYLFPQISPRGQRLSLHDTSISQHEAGWNAEGLALTSARFCLFPGNTRLDSDKGRLSVWRSVQLFRTLLLLKERNENGDKLN